MDLKIMEIVKGMKPNVQTSQGRIPANPSIGCVTMSFAILPQLSIRLSDISPKSWSITSADISRVVIRLASCGESVGGVLARLVDPEIFCVNFDCAGAFDRDRRLMAGTSSPSSVLKSDRDPTSTPSSSSIECKRNTSGW